MAITVQILAYGETGSGKTYTMTGGPEKVEQGIIPRALEYIFEQMKERPDSSYNVLFKFCAEVKFS